jgi:hypothetical protein
MMHPILVPVHRNKPSLRSPIAGARASGWQTLWYIMSNTVSFCRGFRPSMGDSAGVTARIVLHDSGKYDQTRKHGPCPAGTHPTAAVFGNGLARAHPSGGQ